MAWLWRLSTVNILPNNFVYVMKASFLNMTWYCGVVAILSTILVGQKCIDPLWWINWLINRINWLINQINMQTRGSINKLPIKLNM